MSFCQAIFFGILQGLTEFLPISSSGHLVILQKFFGIFRPPVAFYTLAHLGTLVALLIFFYKDIKKIFQRKINLLFPLIIATVPIGIFGIFSRRKIEIIFSSLLLVGISFLFTALILFLTTFVENKKKDKKDISQINFLDAVVIGIFQAFSILPGASRSGFTISPAIFQKIEKEDAFRFSFFLGIIAIFGATMLQIPEISSFTVKEAINGILGFLFSASVGFFALKWLQKIVIKGKLHYFGIYCAILGIICILIS